MVDEDPPNPGLAPRSQLVGFSTTATTTTTAVPVPLHGRDSDLARAAAAVVPAPQAVKETHRISIDYNPVSGRKQLNTYEIVRELGRGEHGRVKLGYDLDTHEYVAIKLLNRTEKPRLGRPRGSSTEEKIHREIAILKKCAHPNIVRLREVLDDESSRKIYLVLEFCEKGEIRWQTPGGEPALAREKARDVARNVVLGLEYLHRNGIIHRDIKPANLLVSADDVVKISDFGVSYAVTGDSYSDLELAKTVGTPAFFAPELCVPTEISDSGEKTSPPVSSKVDVWAFGVTLYCLLYGYLPFEADNEYELFRVIASEEVYFPDPGEDEDMKLADNLLKRLLRKDPRARPTMSEIKDDMWLLKGMSPAQRDEFVNCSTGRIEVSNEEVDQAVKGASITSRIKQSLSRIADHIRTRSRSQSRSSIATNRAPAKFSSPPTQSPGASTASSHPSTLTTSTSVSDSRSTISHSSLASSDVIIDEASAVRGRPDLSRPNTNSPGSLDTSAGTSAGSLARSDSRRTSAVPMSPTVAVPENVIPVAAPLGLMPMNFTDANSLSGSKAGSLEDLGSIGSGSEGLKSRRSEPRLASLPRDEPWDSDSSSSSEDEDSGELTLVITRNRSRSMDRSNLRGGRASSQAGC